MDLKAKIIRFCALRERSEKQVKEKLYTLNAPVEWLEILKEEGWWNQERYAKAYAYDHWNLHHWGKAKINQELKREGVVEELRALAIETIPQDQYIHKLARMIQRKIETRKESITDDERYKLRMHFLRKGYTFAEIELAEQDGES